MPTLTQNVLVVSCCAAAAAMAHPVAANNYAIGMMNWVTNPIMDDTDRTALTTFATSATTPSIAGGWVIQEVADTIQGGANFQKVDAYVQALDDAGMHLSLNYGDISWDGTTQGVSSNVTLILNYINACSATLATNVGPNGPTIDLNLDVEPKGVATTADWITMLGTVHGLIQTHNSSGANIKVTLSAFMPKEVQTEIASGNLWNQVWANVDTLIVMAYRNLPCFTAPCTGLDTPPCDDGFMKWGIELASNTPAGKHCAIALELDFSITHLDGGDSCWKISFGATGIYNHPNSADPQTYRRNFLIEAMNEGWGLLSTSQKQVFHPNGAFILNSYQWLSCFRDGVPVTGGGACSSTGPCGDSSRCIPRLANNPPDLNYDGVVNSLDIDVLHDYLGTCDHDANLDGLVNIEDLLTLLEGWGACH
jgi:hypothetical protein